MSRYIELTDLDGNTVIVFPAYIAFAAPSSKDGTYMELSNGRGVTVREPLATVLERINPIPSDAEPLIATGLQRQCTCIPQHDLHCPGGHVYWTNLKYVKEAPE